MLTDLPVIVLYDVLIVTPKALRGDLGAGVRLEPGKHQGKAGGPELPTKPDSYPESMGEWLRHMNRQGTCYIYVHTFTQTLVSTRPEGAGPYPEDLALEADKKRKEDAEVVKKKAEEEARNAFPNATVSVVEVTMPATA